MYQDDMGWAAGSEVMNGILQAALKYVPESQRKAFYVEVIKTLENRDWDTQGECLGIDPLYDAALREVHPDWDDEN